VFDLLRNLRIRPRTLVPTLTGKNFTTDTIAFIFGLLGAWIRIFCFSLSSHFPFAYLVSFVLSFFHLPFHPQLSCISALSSFLCTYILICCAVIKDSFISVPYIDSLAS
jgi:hypothetical protein